MGPGRLGHEDARLAAREVEDRQSLGEVGDGASIRCEREAGGVRDRRQDASPVAQPVGRSQARGPPEGRIEEDPRLSAAARSGPGGPRSCRLAFDLAELGAVAEVVQPPHDRHQAPDPGHLGETLALQPSPRPTVGKRVPSLVGPSLLAVRAAIASQLHPEVIGHGVARAVVVADAGRFGLVTRRFLVVAHNPEVGSESDQLVQLHRGEAELEVPFGPLTFPVLVDGHPAVAEHPDDAQAVTGIQLQHHEVAAFRPLGDRAARERQAAYRRYGRRETGDARRQGEPESDLPAADGQGVASPSVGTEGREEPHPRVQGKHPSSAFAVRPGEDLLRRGCPSVSPRQGDPGRRERGRPGPRRPLLDATPRRP